MRTKFRTLATLRLLGMIFAFLGLPSASFADNPTTETKTGYVYLGRLGDDGKLIKAAFDHVPVLKVSLEKSEEVRLKDEVTITCLDSGSNLRATHSPTSEVIGRLPSGSKVKLKSVYVSFSYVWGKVDASLAKVLHVSVSSPAVDGFTGRSGFGPSTSAKG